MNRSEEIDPLALLKDATMRGEKITADAEKKELFFESSNLRLPFATQMAWRRSDKQDVLYSLGELYFYVKMMKDGPGAYNRECHNSNVAAVAFKDKSELSQFFTSKNERPSIDAEIWATTLIKRDGQPMRKRDEKAVRKEDL